MRELRTQEVNRKRKGRRYGKERKRKGGKHIFFTSIAKRQQKGKKEDRKKTGRGQGKEKTSTIRRKQEDLKRTGRRKEEDRNLQELELKLLPELHLRG